MFKRHQSGKKEAKSEPPSSSTKFTSDNDDPYATFSVDQARIQIITPSAPDKSSLERELYVYALEGKWDKAKFIYDKFPDTVCTPLTANGDTALHVAVSANKINFVQPLVERMTQEALEILNCDGNTAFCVAAVSGNGGLFETMIKKNEKLPLIRGQDTMLPVHLAALTGHHEIVRGLSSKNEDLLKKMAPKDTERLFFMTIECGMCDVADTLFGKDPKLAVARNDKGLTALHMLARKSSQKFYMQGRGSRLNAELQLLKDVWSYIRQFEYQNRELVTKPSPVLFDAVKSDNVHAVKWLLYKNPELLTQKDSNGQNLLHFAVLYRRQSIFYHILKIESANLLKQTVDNERNNILHLAARQPEEGVSSLNTKTRRHLWWFKEVEKRVPGVLREMRNNKGEKPWDILYDNHKKLSKEAKEVAGGIANSGMIVATLIATVAFAAALTVPGDKTSAWFIVFVLTNAVALFTSSASIISFLTIFTSPWFKENEYITSVLPSLINLGLALLFISIATLSIAFAAASFLIFGHISKWVAYVVLSLGLLPILLFGNLQFSLFDGLSDYAVWSVHYHGSKLNIN